MSTSIHNKQVKGIDINPNKEVYHIAKNNKIFFINRDYCCEWLNYIQSDGRQYLDTGIRGSELNRTIAELKIDTIVSNLALFGSYDPIRRVYVYTSKVARLQHGTNAINFATLSLGARYKFDLDSIAGTLKLNDSIVATFTPQTLSTNNRNEYLMCSLSARPEWPVSGQSLTCYGEQMFVNNVLVRNFIPCRLKVNIPDSVCANATKSHVAGDIGMWDVVNDKFYANSGTGAFIAG